MVDFALEIKVFEWWDGGGDETVVKAIARGQDKTTVKATMVAAKPTVKFDNGVIQGNDPGSAGQGTSTSNP